MRAVLREAFNDSDKKQINNKLNNNTMRIFTRVLSLLFTIMALQTSAQEQMFKTGMLIDDKLPAGMELFDFDALGFGEALPDSVSLVEYAPYPGNQGSFATCVGWAYGYCATSILYSQKFNIKNRTAITALAMCPFSIYNKIKESYDSRCSMGTHMHLAARELRKNGTKRFHLNEVGCGESSAKDTAYRIFKVDHTYAIWDNYQAKTATEAMKILNTKKALAAKKPVLIGFKTTRSFCYDIRRSDGFWDKDLNRLYETGGHAMCIVGYDNKKFGGAFLLQNSWGEFWGKDGYAWITYKDYANYTYNAYVIELDEEDTKTSVIKPKGGCEYGNCKNSYSRFRFENGDAYEGDVKDGMPQGYGIYQYTNGDVFTGMFNNGKKEGKGKYYFADGTVKVAYWVADTINAGGDYLEYGFGKIEANYADFTGYYKDENWLYGTYKSRSAYSPSSYSGKFTDGQKNGFGVKTHTSYLYVGTIENDAYRNGYAFINTKDKRISIYNYDKETYKKLDNKIDLCNHINLFAEFKADTLATLDKKMCTYGDCENGYGRYTYPSGNTFDGYFMNGYRNGYGVYTLKEGDKVSTYEGVYFANQRHEVGKITMSDGSSFIGQFEFNKKSGYGIYIAKDKNAGAGLWEDDKYVEWEEELGFGGADDPKAKEREAKTEGRKKHRALPQQQFKLK